MTDCGEMLHAQRLAGCVARTIAYVVTVGCLSAVGGCFIDSYYDGHYKVEAIKHTTSWQQFDASGLNRGEYPWQKAIENPNKAPESTDGQ